MLLQSSRPRVGRYGVCSHNGLRDKRLGWRGIPYGVARARAFGVVARSAAARRFPVCPSWSDIEFTQEVTAEEVRTCVGKGADPNAVFNCGVWTRPLGMAARQDNAEAVRALIAAGAKVNVQDEEGDTALHDAARHARSDRTIQALLDGGADAMLRTHQREAGVGTMHKTTRRYGTPPSYASGCGRSS